MYVQYTISLSFSIRLRHGKAASFSVIQIWAVFILQLAMCVLFLWFFEPLFQCHTSLLYFLFVDIVFMFVCMQSCSLLSNFFFLFGGAFCVRVYVRKCIFICFASCLMPAFTTWYQCICIYDERYLAYKSIANTVWQTFYGTQRKSLLFSRMKYLYYFMAILFYFLKHQQTSGMPNGRNLWQTRR